MNKDIINFILFQAEKTMDMIHKLTNLVYFDQIREDVR